MINDQSAKDEVAKEWAAIKKLSGWRGVSRMVGRSFVMGSSPPKGFQNLQLVLGYAVLDEILSTLVNQGVFACRGWMLGSKMKASENVLPWKNYALVEAGKDERNGLAHEAKLVDDDKCLVYIDAIEAELRAWGVITD